MCNNCKDENKVLSTLLKIFLVVGIVAGICVIAKILFDRYKKKMEFLCDGDCDCDFECLENDDLDCDCENCQYAMNTAEETIADVVEAEVEA